MERNAASFGYRLGEREPTLLHAVDPSFSRTQYDYSWEEIDRLLPVAAEALDLIWEKQQKLREMGCEVPGFLIEDERRLLDTLDILGEDAVALALAEDTGDEAESFLRSLS